jgi:ABC-type oligopeptide transport system substrate-binding subunit
VSSELKSIFFRVALVSTIVAAMPIGFAKTPAQAEKVLRVAFPAPDDGFDMVKTFNFYSGNVADVIFERLVQYDYLANPVKLVPATAQSLPY